MTQCVYGVAISGDGFAWRRSPRLEWWETPPLELRYAQPNHLPIDWSHNHQPVGRIIHLEYDGQNVWAVGEVSDHVRPEVGVWVGSELRHVAHDLFWSVERSRAPADIELHAISLAQETARVRARPVVFRPGSAHMAAYTSTDSFERDLLRRASEANLKRHGGPIVIAGLVEHAAAPQFAAAAAPIEIRSTPYNVSVGKREIIAVVAPYEHETQNVVIKGRRCREVFAVGAFDGVATQANTIRLNFDHQPERVIGKAVEFATGRSDGLVATFRVSRTRAGDEALEMAADDLVDCSVGFGVVRESWPQHDLRRVHEGYLDHVALTSAPAYSSAKVLAVRGDLAGVS